VLYCSSAGQDGHLILKAKASSVYKFKPLNLHITLDKKANAKAKAKARAKQEGNIGHIYTPAIFPAAYPSLYFLFSYPSLYFLF
jgi:hypothetical protein